MAKKNQRPDTDCDGTTTRLYIVVVVYAFYVVTMIVFGLLTHALVLISEGLHAASDWFSYGMTLWFHGAQYRPPTPRYPFGWLRATVIGGVLNGLFLVSLALFITLESITRFVEPHKDIDFFKVIIVGCIGLGVNIGCTVLMWTAPKDAQVHGHAHFGDESHGHSHGGDGPDLNIKGMLMHLLIDVCSSFVVLLSGMIGYFVKHQSWTQYVDPIGAMLVALGALIVAIPLLRHCATLLMQTPPESYDSTAVDKGLRAIPGVVGLSRTTAVWRLTDSSTAAQVHLEVRRAPGSTDVTHNDVLTRARLVLENNGVDLDHATVQITYDTTPAGASVAGGTGAYAVNGGGGSGRGSNASTNSDHKVELA